jgi:hypothetical protein
MLAIGITLNDCRITVLDGVTKTTAKRATHPRVERKRNYSSLVFARNDCRAVRTSVIHYQCVKTVTSDIAQYLRY